MDTNNYSLDHQDADKKKKKGRGNRKEQHRRRRIRQQQVKLNAATVEHAQHSIAATHTSKNGPASVITEESQVTLFSVE